MAQQMKMIATLAESNQESNKRMEQQMALITSLQQTVADLVIGVSDSDSDASTITSNKQRKRRIHHHPFNSTQAMQVRYPGDSHKYIKFSTLADQEGDTAAMHTHIQADNDLQDKAHKAEDTNMDKVHTPEEDASNHEEKSDKDMSGEHNSPCNTTNYC